MSLAYMSYIMGTAGSAIEKARRKANGDDLRGFTSFALKLKI